MKLLSKSLFSISLSLTAATAFAVGSQGPSVLITGMQAGQALTNNYGPVLITFASPASGSCATGSNRNSFAIDPTTEQGRAAISLALAAYTQGRTVKAVGTGNCSDIYPGIEDLGYLVTTD